MILSFSAALTLLFSIVLWYLLTQFTKNARLLNKFPGPYTLPFIGGLLSAAWTPRHKVQEYLGKCFEFYGNTARIWVLHRPMVITRDLELIEKLLSSKVHTEKNNAAAEGSFFVGTTALATSPPHLWQPTRKALAPAFSKSMLESYMDIFHQKINLMIQIIDQQVFGNPDKYLDLHPTFCRATCDAISDCIWDEKFNFQKRPEIRLYETIMECSSHFAKRMWEPWIHKIPFVYKLFGFEQHEMQLVQKLHEIFPEKFLQEQRKYFNKKRTLGEASKKYMALLCAKDASLSDIDMFYAITSILFAGMETSSTCAAIVLFMLGNHKDIQEKVFAEIQSELGTDWQKEITTEDLKRLPYMDLVIKESLRLCTPAHNIGRNTGADIVLSNGLVIPKGTDVLINLQGVHLDPNLYPKPKEFIPERFQDESLATQNPYGYLLFSKGPRNYIGMQFGLIELKLMLIKILMKFKVDSANTLEDQHFKYTLITEAIGGLKIKLIHR